MRIDTNIRGTLLVKTQGPDGLVYFLESLHGTVSFTNLATGKSFTNVLNVINKDLKVTDNGDGTLTVLALSTGSVVSLQQPRAGPGRAADRSQWHAHRPG